LYDVDSLSGKYLMLFSGLINNCKSSLDDLSKKVNLAEKQYS
jgi:hypothetical protein